MKKTMSFVPSVVAGLTTIVIGVGIIGTIFYVVPDCQDRADRRHFEEAKRHYELRRIEEQFEKDMLKNN